MDWSGLEWVLPLYELSMLVVPIYAFIRLYSRIKQGVLKKPRAILYYAGIVVTPIVLYSLFFFGLVGLEEISDFNLVSEGLARSFIIVIGLGLIIWLVALLIFSLTLVFLRRPTSK